MYTVYSQYRQTYRQIEIHVYLELSKISHLKHTYIHIFMYNMYVCMYTIAWWRYLRKTSSGRRLSPMTTKQTSFWWFQLAPILHLSYCVKGGCGWIVMCVCWRVVEVVCVAGATAAHQAARRGSQDEAQHQVLVPPLRREGRGGGGRSDEAQEDHILLVIIRVIAYQNKGAAECGYSSYHHFYHFYSYSYSSSSSSFIVTRAAATASSADCAYYHLRRESRRWRRIRKLGMRAMNITMLIICVYVFYSTYFFMSIITAIFFSRMT